MRQVIHRFLAFVYSMVRTIILIPFYFVCAILGIPVESELGKYKLRHTDKDVANTSWIDRMDDAGPIFGD